MTQSAQVGDPAAARAVGGESKRIDWIDIAKGIAILLVIVGHTVDNPSDVRHLIFSFHMPLFFILAGFTFKSKPWKDLLATSATRLLVPYLMVSLIWRIASTITWNLGPIFTPDFFANWLADAFYGSGSYFMFADHSIGAIWFLLALFVSRVAFNAIAKAFERFGVHVALQAVLMVALGYAGVKWYQSFGVLPLDADVCAYGLMLMWFGYAVRAHGLSGLLGKWYFGIAAGVLWMLFANNSTLEISVRVYDGFAFSTAGALCGTWFACWISHGIARVKQVPVLGLVERYLAFCGRNSMAIYCLHVIGWLVLWANAVPFKELGFEKLQAAAVQILCITGLAHVLKRA